MQQILAVGAGGFVGAVLRYLISAAMLKRFPDFPPAGTLLVNVVGCAVIGVVMALISEHNALSPNTRLLLVTGILGSLTTFSTFGYDTLRPRSNGTTRAGRRLCGRQPAAGPGGSDDCARFDDCTVRRKQLRISLFRPLTGNAVKHF